MIDVSAFQLLLLTVTSWLDRREREVVAYLIEENRVLRRQVGGRRLRLTDDDRRKLVARAYRLGRQALREVASIVTPDTLLRWHRQLIACKWTYARQGTTRREVLAEVRELIRRMAEENPGWGYTRIQGALENLGLLDAQTAEQLALLIQLLIHLRVGEDDRLCRRLPRCAPTPSSHWRREHDGA